VITAFAAILLVVLTMTPLAVSLRRDRAGRDRREAALTLHRAQLAELDRDLADGRLAQSEHEAARLEVQRRLLAAADMVPAETRTGNLKLALAALFLVPLVAAGLYMVHGQPGMPAMPLAARKLAADQKTAQVDTLIRTLRDRLAEMDQTSDKAFQGYVLLGNAEQNRGDLDAAATAWRKAVSIRFDPSLAAMAAEARTLVDGGQVSADSAALFARALAEGAKDAPWRDTAQKRLAQAGL
jgi:cytochrome c-type biogenesis protein CcmH